MNEDDEETCYLEVTDRKQLIKAIKAVPSKGGVVKFVHEKGSTTYTFKNEVSEYRLREITGMIRKVKGAFK